MIDERLRILFTDEGNDIVKKLRESFASNNVNASGKLSKSTEAIVKGGNDSATLQIEINDYGTLLESGRGPTKQSGGNLFASIRQWIDDKGLSLPGGFKNKDSLAWAITKKIHRDGTRAFPNKGPKVLSSVIDDKLVANIEEKVATLVSDEALKGIDSIINTKYKGASN